MNWTDLTLPPLNLWNFPRQPYIRKGSKMQITLTDIGGTYSITLEEGFIGLDKTINYLVKPILAAAGYTEEQLAEYFVKEEEEFLFFKDWDNEEVAAKEPVCKKAPMTPVEKKVVAKAPEAMAKMFV